MLRKVLESAQNRIEIVVGGGISFMMVVPLLQQLPYHDHRMSIHVYSSVLKNGVTDEYLVRELVQKVHQKM
jgi:copper homeostasis protein CutC